MSISSNTMNNLLRISTYITGVIIGGCSKIIGGTLLKVGNSVLGGATGIMAASIVTAGGTPIEDVAVRNRVVLIPRPGDRC